MGKNQYNDIVQDNLYIEYKIANEERKKQIEDKIFYQIREINTFPEDDIVEMKDDIKILRSLYNLNPKEYYNNGVIKPNSSGLSLTYKYYPNIWDVKKKDKNFSMREGFFDDKELRNALRLNLRFDQDISGLRAWLRMNRCGYTTNFRPSVAKVVYDTNLKPNSFVFDYSAGYGGRLLGAWSAENVSKYVGLEPNTETFNNGNKFIKYLNKISKLGGDLNKDLELYKIGSESFDYMSLDYESYFDMAFSSPPYFDLEIYCEEETQSYKMFKSYKEWIKFYLRPTILNSIKMLKPDGIFAINIHETLYNIKNIVKCICNEEDFRLYKIDNMEIKVRPGDGMKGTIKEKFEPIWYFKRIIY